MAPEGGAGLYVHLPFCSAICPYCDFAVLTGSEARRRGFLDSLTQEALLLAQRQAALEFDTVFLGGGTPSLHPPAELELLLDTLARHFRLSGALHLSMEANPEDAGDDHLRTWRRLGVDTLSLGVQAFDADSLRFLGRRHTASEAREAITAARAAGFGTVSIDLIFALPGQRAEDWRAELEAAAELEPDHVSCYQLTLHRSTPFGVRAARGELREMPNDEQAELFELTHRVLPDLGYAAYEVSNFARAPEHRSRHNRKYWSHLPYLGLGPSAHSFDGGARWWNERRLPAYEARLAAGKLPIAEREELTPEQLALEALMLGFRTIDGIDLESLRARFGVDLLASNATLIDELEAAGQLELTDGHLRPTLDGLLIADALPRRFSVS